MEDYEKKYKDALAKAREIHRNEDEKRFDMEWLFPELKESEDERIRKEMITAFSRLDEDSTLCGVAYNYKKWIAWLEKQGSSSVKWQKNTPDNKPATNHSVLMKTTHGIAEGYFVGSLWFQFRWSSNIKDSDVLAWMELSDLDEQAEQKPAWSEEDEIEIPFGAKDSELQEETYYIPKGFHVEIDDDKVVIKKGEKSVAWSDEDEENLQHCCMAISADGLHTYEDKQEMEVWLKSLKCRMKGKED